MATRTLKTLGQSAPSAATLTDLYTVPSSTNAVCSTLTVCNRSDLSTAFRVAIRLLGGGVQDEDYLYYDIPIPGNDTFSATIGIALEATDVISVYATLSTLSFNLSGQEIT